MNAIVTAAPAPVAHRGSGRRTFHVVLGGHEPITAIDGTITQEFLIDGIDIEVPSGGVFGWGELRAIDAYVAEHYPGKSVLDVWPVVQ